MLKNHPPPSGALVHPPLRSCRKDPGPGPGHPHTSSERLNLPGPLLGGRKGCGGHPAGGGEAGVGCGEAGEALALGGATLVWRGRWKELARTSWLLLSRGLAVVCTVSALLPATPVGMWGVNSPPMGILGLRLRSHSGILVSGWPTCSQGPCTHSPRFLLPARHSWPGHCPPMGTPSKLSVLGARTAGKTRAERTRWHREEQSRKATCPAPSSPLTRRHHHQHQLCHLRSLPFSWHGVSRLLLAGGPLDRGGGGGLTWRPGCAGAGSASCPPRWPRRRAGLWWTPASCPPPSSSRRMPGSPPPPPPPPGGREGRGGR